MDRDDVATALRRAEPSHRAGAAGYLDELGRRAPLDARAERSLVSAAQAGEAR